MSKTSKGEPRAGNSMPVITADETNVPRPSLFSPPVSPRTSVMADAAVLNYSVPAAYDPSLIHLPDCQSVLVHAIPSSHKEGGIQAVILLHPKTFVPPHLGLPSPSSSNIRPEETAFLLTSSPNEPFVRFDQAPKDCTAQISVTEYLTLLQFFVKDWSRLHSKLEMDTQKMKDNRDPVAISQHLSFFSHGCCLYSIALSPRLVLKIKADSRKPLKDGEYLSGWLEQRVGNRWQEFVLALPAVIALSHNTHAVATLSDIVTQYKNKSRKRSKPVA